MVLASTQFPGFSLGPFKRDLTAKPFAELRSFVMALNRPVLAPFASCFQHPDDVVATYGLKLGLVSYP